MTLTLTHMRSALAATLFRNPRPWRVRCRRPGASFDRAAAVADLGRIKLSGPVAWWFWGLVHVLFLANLQDRFSVSRQWFWSYLT